MKGTSPEACSPWERRSANLVRWTGAGFADAVKCATSTPAALLGLGDRGQISTGLRSDLSVLDAEGAVVITMVDGEVAYRRSGTYSWD